MWAGPRYRRRAAWKQAQRNLVTPRQRINQSSGHSFRRKNTTEAPIQTPATVPERRDERMQALESILFLAREPLNARKLSQHAQLADGTEALTLIRRLNELYQAEVRAFRVEQVAGGYQLMTHPALADWLRRLAGTPPEVRLSTPAMETLAVVAYRQPVQRADVEAIRGVACGEMLRQLMERELVKIVGRSEELGRPFLYGTTNRFLHVFGLEDIDELPRAEMLREPLAIAPSNADGPDDTTTGSAPAKKNELETKETDKVTATIGDIHEELLAPPTEAVAAAGTPAPKGTIVAEFDDDDDDLGDDFEDDDEDDFDDEFDDDYDDDEWDDDELEDDELEDEEGDDWEEVDDDDEELDEEEELDDEEEEDDEFDDDDEEDDWEEDDED